MTEKEGQKERERECTEGGVGEAERKAHKCIIVSDRMQGEDVSSGSVITFLSQTISSIKPTEAASSLLIPISNYFDQIKSPIDKLLRSLSLLGTQWEYEQTKTNNYWSNESTEPISLTSKSYKYEVRCHAKSPYAFSKLAFHPNYFEI